jgi:hypothetical protein
MKTHMAKRTEKDQKSSAINLSHSLLLLLVNSISYPKIGETRMCRHTSQSSPEFDGKIIEWSIPQIERTWICILFQLERFLIPYVSQPIRYAQNRTVIKLASEQRA